MATIEDYLFTKRIKWVLWALFGCFVALLIFIAGFAMGERQGGHGGFAVRVQGPGTLMGDMALPEGFIVKDHGAVGTVENASSSTLLLRQRDGSSVMVYLSSTTPVSGAKAGGMSTSSAIQPGTFVIVVGDPYNNNGQNGIEARFVRVLTPPPSGAPMLKGMIEYKSF